MAIHTELRAAPFDALAEVRHHEAALAMVGKVGALSLFIGRMRDFNEGREVQRLFLEHYPGMTEKHLHEICQRATEQWAALDILVLHRTGEIEPGDDMVLIAAWAAHRGDAIDTARFIIEDLKHKAPFWKKEATQAGEQWVERNTSGYQV